MAKIKRLKDKNGNMHSLGDADVDSYESTLSGATKNVPYSSAVKAAIDTASTAASTALQTHANNQNNPHNVTKAQVGLSNVEDKSSATIRGEITAANVTSALGYTPIDSAKMGVASGVATLDTDGKVPASQLPAYVDDVIEGYLHNGKFYQDSSYTIEITAMTGKIYTDLATNKTYRWSGSQYTEISSSLALGETSSTAYRGDRGKIAYDHSQVTGADSIHHTHSNKSDLDSITSAKMTAWDAKVDSVAAGTSNGQIKVGAGGATATDITIYTHPAYTAATAAAKKVGRDATGHVVLGDALSKSDLGLGSVENLNADSIRQRVLYELYLISGKWYLTSSSTTCITPSNVNSTTSASGTYSATFLALDSSGTGLYKVSATGATSSSGAFTTFTNTKIANILTLGETSSTAYRGDYGKTAYDHSQVSGDSTIHHTHSNKSALDTITADKISAWDGKQPAGNYKTTQTAKTDPTASGTSVTFISTLTQNANGEVSATKKTVQSASASQSGLMSSTDFSKLSGISSNAKKVESSTTNGNIKIDGTETNVYTHPASTAADAAAVKVGRDATGHVVIGDALATADISGLQNALDAKLDDSQLVTSWSSTTSDTKIPSEKLVKAGLDAKQASLSFDGTYNSSSNKAATVSSVTSRIQALDVTDTAVSTQFVTAVSETDGKVAVTRKQPVISDVSGLQTALDGKMANTIGFNVVSDDDGDYLELS